MLTITEAVLVELGSMALVAVTVTFVAADVVGALNRPVADMLPALTDQVTPI
jgi:hypothetical protein